MEIRREKFDSKAAIALADAVEEELLTTYDGEPGSGGLPAASIFEPANGGAFLVGRSMAKRSPAAASPATTT